MILDLPERNYFYIGEEIHGVAHVNLQKPYPGNCLKAMLKCKETVNYTDDGDKKKNKESFYREEIIFRDPMVDKLREGKYHFPFSFKVPSDLFTSFGFCGDKKS